MSEKTPVSKSEYSIVRAIINLFKSGEEGKIEAFFAKVRKTLSREIQTLEKAMEVTTFNHDGNVDELKEAIEDAQSAVDNAYMQIDFSRINTNSDSEEFAAQYWKNVELAEANLKTLNEKLQQTVGKYEETIKEQKEQIVERKRRMTRISETK